MHSDFHVLQSTHEQISERSAALQLKILFICLFFSLAFTTVWAQENEEAQDEGTQTADTEQTDEPRELSAEEKAQQADEKKRSLEELLAVPFNKLKADEADSISAKSGSDNTTVAKHKGEVKLPSPPEQSKAERDLEKQLDTILRKMMPKAFVGVTVSVRYIMETLPVTKHKKKISKLKLPGFENNVWVPTQIKEVVGIVNQVRPYTTIFAVVNTPISLFNVEVLRQKLSEEVDSLNLMGRDVLKVVHVPFTTPAALAVESMRNAAAEQAARKKRKVPELTGEDAEEPGMVEANKEIAQESAIQPQPAPQVSLLEPEAIFEPEPQPTRVDMKTRVETTRYLLQSREAYLKNDYDTAITAIRKAIELNPASSQAYEMLGSIYYRLGWNGMAVENWERALNLDPTNEGLKKYLMRLSRQG